MSQRRKWTWSAYRCAELAAWLNQLVECDVIRPHCRPCPDPIRGRPAILAEWFLYGRMVELYLPLDRDEPPSVIRRDGGPSNVLPLATWGAAIDAAREGVRWIEERRPR